MSRAAVAGQGGGGACTAAISCALTDGSGRGCRSGGGRGRGRGLLRPGRLLGGLRLDCTHGRVRSCGERGGGNAEWQRKRLRRVRASNGGVGCAGTGLAQQRRRRKRGRGGLVAGQALCGEQLLLGDAFFAQGPLEAVHGLPQFLLPRPRGGVARVSRGMWSELGEEEGGRRCTDLVGEKAVGGYPRLGARRDGAAEVVVNEGLSDAWIHGAPTNQWYHQQKGSGFAFSPHHRATGSRSWSGGGGMRG